MREELDAILVIFQHDTRIRWYNYITLHTYWGNLRYVFKWVFEEYNFIYNNDLKRWIPFEDCYGCFSAIQHYLLSVLKIYIFNKLYLKFYSKLNISSRGASFISLWFSNINTINYLRYFIALTIRRTLFFISSFNLIILFILTVLHIYIKSFIYVSTRVTHSITRKALLSRVAHR